jgi:hypothetical protein
MHPRTSGYPYFRTHGCAHNESSLQLESAQKQACKQRMCNTANGGCTIILSGNFAMGSYSGEISFSGKAITLWGQGKVLDAAHTMLDAAGGGRFFISESAGSFLELHDALLQNGYAVNVSG